MNKTFKNLYGPLNLMRYVIIILLIIMYFYTKNSVFLYAEIPFILGFIVSYSSKFKK